MKQYPYYLLTMKMGKSSGVEIQTIQGPLDEEQSEQLNEVLICRDNFFVDGSIEVSMLCEPSYVQNGRKEVHEAMISEIERISKHKKALVKSLEKNSGMISLFQHAPVGLDNPLSINWSRIQKLSEDASLYHYFNKDEEEHRYVVTKNGVIEKEFSEWQMKKLSDYIHQYYPGNSIQIKNRS